MGQNFNYPEKNCCICGKGKGKLKQRNINKISFTYIKSNIVIINNQCILCSACPCQNGGSCTGIDLDNNGIEDCDCTAAVGFQGPICNDAIGRKPLL